MRIRDIGTRTLAGIAVAVVLLAAPVLAQESMEADQAAIDACKEVVIGNFEQVYPKAKRFAWDPYRQTVEESLFGRQLKGGGDYRGEGGKNRTMKFDCAYDPYAGEVVKAVWESSHDPGVVRQVVDLTGDMEIMPGKVLEACTAALDETIRETWENYQKIELAEETLDRRKTRDGYLLRGGGRFLGVADNWHRYDFRCTYDGSAADLKWKHYGKEVEE